MKTEDFYELYKAHPKISTDSRADVADSIFFALNGENFNGNIFALQALQNGAKYAVVSDQKLASVEGCIFVENVLTFLQNLASYHRRQLNIPIISITGTNGKTTTKELINSVLSTQFSVFATVGNFNNHIGVPLSLLSIKSSNNIGIIEMGANHQNEIAQLCEIAMPNFGIITNIGKAHLEGFGSYGGVIKAKSELYKYIEKTNGTIFYNSDNELLCELVNKLKVTKFSYGNSNSSNFVAQFVDSNPFTCVKYKNNIVESKLTGSYNFENIITEIAVGEYFNISSENISRAIENYAPSNMRSQLKKTELNTLYIDAYNANPMSMSAAIENFAKLKVRNKWLIIGEMRELGEFSITEHQILIDLIKIIDYQQVILIGESFNSFEFPKNFIHFSDTNAARNWFEAAKICNAHILIKGSRANKLENLLVYL